MKMGNGMGSVTKLSGKRRNPWIARVTDHWEFNKETGKNRQIRKVVGYYPTRKAALEALVDYNKNPYDLSADALTFAEIYEKWSAEHFQEIQPASCNTWISAFKHSTPLYDMKMRDIRVNHLENVLDSSTASNNIKQYMRLLYKSLFQYAMKYEIVEKNYGELCHKIKRPERQSDHVPFSNAEIRLLWSKVDVGYTDMILIGIYTGWRPQELFKLKIKDVDLDNWTITGGLKTDAGRNRIVPIHSCIKKLVTRNYKEAVRLGSDYLFNSPKGTNFKSYANYRTQFDNVMDLLHMHHRPHDTRHTFVTLGKEAGMNEYILKLIAGHSIADVTEKVYTHRTIEDLRKEIERIKKPR